MSVLQKDGVLYEVNCWREPSWMRDQEDAGLDGSSLAGAALVCVNQ